MAVVQRNSRKRSIGLKLTLVTRHLWQSFDAKVESGITRAKWSVIVTVARNPGSTQRTIAAKMEVREVSAGRLIDRLCNDGFLERRENPCDRRAYCIHLTPKAQSMLESVDRLAKTHEEQVFAGFDDAELALLEKMLDRISANISTDQQEPIEIAD